MVSIAGVTVSDLAAEFGTPLFVIDEDDFRSRCREIADAVNGQLRQLPYYCSFFNTTTEPAIRLAGKIASLAPAGLTHVMFSNSGSEANELALRLCRTATGPLLPLGRSRMSTSHSLPSPPGAVLNSFTVATTGMMGALTGGAVVPESFTHGSAAQRSQWFRRGFESGQVSACDTFRE